MGPGSNLQGLASYCWAETTFTFHFSISTLSNAFWSINNREMKSESGFSLLAINFAKTRFRITNWKICNKKRFRGTICNRMIQTIICKVCKNNPEQNFARYGVEQEFATFWNKIIQNNNCHEKVIHNDNIHVLHENYVEPQFAKLSTTKMIRNDNL